MYFISLFLSSYSLPFFSFGSTGGRRDGEGSVAVASAGARGDQRDMLALGEERRAARRCLRRRPILMLAPLPCSLTRPGPPWPSSHPPLPWPRLLESKMKWSARAAGEPELPSALTLSARHDPPHHNDATTSWAPDPPPPSAPPQRLAPAPGPNGATRSQRGRLPLLGNSRSRLALPPSSVELFAAAPSGAARGSLVGRQWRSPGGWGLAKGGRRKRQGQKKNISPLFSLLESEN